jgi:Na+-transporting NADH:ubiquinone oxidoreductase subunit NqrC
VHIANPSGKGQWEGLNIYEANDEVRIYVVPADGSGKRKKK